MLLGSALSLIGIIYAQHSTGYSKCIVGYERLQDLCKSGVKCLLCERSFASTEKPSKKDKMPPYMYAKNTKTYTRIATCSTPRCDSFYHSHCLISKCEVSLTSINNTVSKSSDFNRNFSKVGTNAMQNSVDVDKNRIKCMKCKETFIPNVTEYALWILKHFANNKLVIRSNDFSLMSSKRLYLDIFLGKRLSKKELCKIGCKLPNDMKNMHLRRILRTALSIGAKSLDKMRFCRNFHGFFKLPRGCQRYRNYFIRSCMEIFFSAKDTLEREKREFLNVIDKEFTEIFPPHFDDIRKYYRLYKEEFSQLYSRIIEKSVLISTEKALSFVYELANFENGALLCYITEKTVKSPNFPNEQLLNDILIRTIKDGKWLPQQRTGLDYSVQIWDSALAFLQRIGNAGHDRIEGFFRAVLSNLFMVPRETSFMGIQVPRTPSALCVFMMEIISTHQNNNDSSNKDKNTTDKNIVRELYSSWFVYDFILAKIYSTYSYENTNMQRRLYLIFGELEKARGRSSVTYLVLMEEQKIRNESLITMLQQAKPRVFPKVFPREKISVILRHRAVSNIGEIKVFKRFNASQAIKEQLLRDALENTEFVNYRSAGLIYSLIKSDAPRLKDCFFRSLRNGCIGAYGALEKTLQLQLLNEAIRNRRGGEILFCIHDAEILARIGNNVIRQMLVNSSFFYRLEGLMEYLICALYDFEDKSKITCSTAISNAGANYKVVAGEPLGLNQENYLFKNVDFCPLLKFYFEEVILSFPASIRADYHTMRKFMVFYLSCFNIQRTELDRIINILMTCKCNQKLIDEMV
ncbi:hypothetical protein ENBRE01_1573 [Enteropsectra breve]|nr:hypothetical protein ENBRE01_1573 [Enteropsectra breve]